MKAHIAVKTLPTSALWAELLRRRPCKRCLSGIRHQMPTGLKCSLETHCRACQWYHIEYDQYEEDK